MSKFKKGELVFVRGALDNADKCAIEERARQLPFGWPHGFVQRFITKHKGAYYCECDDGSNIGLEAWEHCEKAPKDVPYNDRAFAPDELAEIEAENQAESDRIWHEEIEEEEARRHAFDEEHGGIPHPGCCEDHY